MNTVDQGSASPAFGRDKAWKLSQEAGADRPAGSRRRRLPAWLIPVICLTIGLVVGALVARQRAHAYLTVVAVNGTVITQDALFSRLQVEAGIPTMHKMVEEELQLQFARKLGLAPTDAQVDAEYAEASRQPGFAQAQIASGQSEGSLKHALRVQLAEAAVFEQGVSVSDAEVRTYYAAQSDPHNPNALFYQPAAITLRAIATAKRADADAAAQELAQNTPFELVASSYSQDPSKVNGGLLDPLVRGRSPLSHSPPLEQAVFALKIGQMIGPVVLDGRWWLFRCEDKTPARTISFDQVRTQARSGALLEKGVALNGAKVAQEFAAFQSSANLQAFWPEYQAALSTNAK